MPHLDSIWGILQESAAEYGDKPLISFIDDGESITYRAALERSTQVARGLLVQGMTKGQKVGIMLRNSALYVYSWFATLGAGLVDVPINPEFRGSLLAHAIKKADVTVLITSQEGLEALGSLGPEICKQLQVVIVATDVCAFTPAEGLVPAGIGRLLGMSDVEAAGRAADGLALPAPDPFGPASIRFTSGSTGLPKGVMMDNGHMLASAKKFVEMMEFGPGDILYSCFPFYHVFASITGVISTLCAGGSMIMARKFSASGYWKDIRDHKVTRAHVLDPLIPLLMKQPPEELDRKHLVKWMYTTAGYYPEFEQRFNIKIHPLYDMSELTVALCYPPGVPRQGGSCGKESGLFDVRIVDEWDHEVPPGVDGEIVVRPRYPNIMFMGYYGDAEQTVAKWRNLWFHTGDRGRKDEEGFYYFLGRLGDRIRRRGVNVSAEQIELVALNNPNVLECTVIAVPSELGEDEIKLCAVLVARAAMTPAKLAQFMAASLPSSLCPRYVELYDTLPKTQTEKIRRAALRDMGDHGLTPDTWDHQRGCYLQGVRA